MGSGEPTTRQGDRRADCYLRSVPNDGLASKLLVAMPQLQDPNFVRSVVLLVHHDAEGAFGVVVNRPVELQASDLFESLAVCWKGNPEMRIYWGGPVPPNSGWVLFPRGASIDFDEDEATSLPNGFAFAGSLRVLEALAEAPPPSLRFFLGYAGWGPGQLEEELASGSWLVTPGTPDAFFGVPEASMWDHAVRGLGVEPAALISTSGFH